MSLDHLTIGFVGLGLMGKPMALNLQRAGAEIVVHNRSQSVVRELMTQGMHPAEYPQDLAQKTSTIILMLTDTPAVEQVLLGRNGLLAGLKPGALVIDMGTTAVMPTRRFAQTVRDCGCEYVDAPVSGGQIDAIEGKLTIMAGGTDGAYARAMPVFEVLGAHITLVGEAGAGQVAKAANQIIVGLTIGAVAEAINLVQKCGVNASNVREALHGGFAWSRIMELHGQRMIDNNFEPGAKSVIQRKDLQQALELAEVVNAALPATKLNRDLYDQLIARGDGGLDHSALIQVLR